MSAGTPAVAGWVEVATAADVAPGPVARTVDGTRIVLWRTADGAVVALDDRCPHRGNPLSTGRVRDGSLQCRYHRWRFGPDGGCVAVSDDDEDVDPADHRVRAHPVVEVDGAVAVRLHGDEERG